MIDAFTFRQKPIVAFLAAMKIPGKPPETAQEAKSRMVAQQKHEKPPQSAENGDYAPGADFEADGEAPAMPLFDADPRREQTILTKTIGSRLREARELCNLTQNEAAKRLGYSNSSKLSKVEGATDTNSVPLWLIVRASKLYDVSVDFLFGLSDDWETGLQRPVQAWLLDRWQDARVRDLAELAKLHRRVTAISSLLPIVAGEAERTAEAVRRFAELNPEFVDMRGSARLAAAAENLASYAASAHSTARRFRIEIGIDRTDQPKPEGEPA